MQCLNSKHKVAFIRKLLSLGKCVFDYVYESRFETLTACHGESSIVAVS